MYVDKLDGCVDTAFSDKMLAEWREEQNRCLRDIERHQNAEHSYMNEGVALLELARNAQSLFERQDVREKRRLLNFVLSNCTWDDGEMAAPFRQPFGLLAETTTITSHSGGNDRGNPAKSEIWLGREDSNLRIPVSKTGALDHLATPHRIHAAELPQHRRFPARAPDIRHLCFRRQEKRVASRRV